MRKSHYSQQTMPRWTNEIEHSWLGELAIEFVYGFEADSVRMAGSGPYGRV